MKKKRFRYHTNGSWFKGNVHIHTTRSDGGLDPLQTASRYAGAGYDFLFLTDHWCVSSPVQDGSPPICLFNGLELDGIDRHGSNYHVVCLGKVEGIDQARGFEEGLGVCIEQNAVLILAHPAWTGNSVEEASRYPFHGVELYNHVCHWLNGKGSGLFHWDSLLEENPGVLGIACDDAHNKPAHPGWNGGWIVVNASASTEEAITEAIRCGTFYSTQGPEIRRLALTEDDLQVETSPVQFARLVGAGSQGTRFGSFDGSLMTEFTFSLPSDFDYVRLEVEDDGGKRAWTNTLFI
jgi:hypothetical protein